MTNSEQHTGHTAVFVKPTSVHIAKLFGLVFVVDSFCSVESDINAVPLDKTGPENRLNRHRSNLTDWQAINNWENPDDTEIIDPIKHRNHQPER